MGVKSGPSLERRPPFMRTSPRLAAWLSAAFFSFHPVVMAEEAPAEIAGLQKAAADFVTAYNKKDAAALAAMFTETGEITDLEGGDTVSGRAGIKARYEEMFGGGGEVPQMALEVASVRLVAPGVAVEDGTFHLAMPGADGPVNSTTYTAVLVKDAGGEWRIASTRSLKDVTEPSGHLASLAEALKGDWTCQRDGVRIDVAYGWDDSGKFLMGEMLVSRPDIDPEATTVRIGWDGSRESVVWWTFDDGGGFSEGVWSRTDDGWVVKTTGTTAQGEATSGTARLVVEGKDRMLWTVSERLLDGEAQPDLELRFVRQAPEPGLAEEEAAAVAPAGTEAPSAEQVAPAGESKPE